MSNIQTANQLYPQAILATNQTPDSNMPIAENNPNTKLSSTTKDRTGKYIILPSTAEELLRLIDELVRYTANVYLKKLFNKLRETLAITLKTYMDGDILGTKFGIENMTKMVSMANSFGTKRKRFHKKFTPSSRRVSKRRTSSYRSPHLPPIL